MKRHQFILALVTLLLPCNLVMAQWDHLEIGLHGGAGFYWGISQQGDYVRTNKVGLWITDSEDKMPPGFETYGAFVRYRFDNHWNVAVKATRQRTHYNEYRYVGSEKVGQNSYYNAMWHLDATAEFNILNYSLDRFLVGEDRTFSVTPYVLLGAGVTMYNKQAVLRERGMTDEKGSNYPMVGAKDVNYTSDYAGKTGVALYIPVGLGVKWRLTYNWQVQASAQYHLYISGTNPNGLSSNIEGGSRAVPYDQLQMKSIGGNHNLLVTIGAAYNFGNFGYKSSSKRASCRCDGYF